MAKRTLGAYKSYNFKDKDPVIDKVRTIVQDEGVSHQKIHELSGVSVTTLYNWFDGPVKRPQHATLMAVVRCLGWDYKLVKVGKQSVVVKRAAAKEAV